MYAHCLEIGTLIKSYSREYCRGLKQSAYLPRYLKARDTSGRLNPSPSFTSTFHLTIYNDSSILSCPSLPITPIESSLPSTTHCSPSLFSAALTYSRATSTIERRSCRVLDQVHMFETQQLKHLNIISMHYLSGSSRLLAYSKKETGTGHRMCIFYFECKLIVVQSRVITAPHTPPNSPNAVA